jgi:predicted metalloprotease with PDZ domain
MRANEKWSGPWESNPHGRRSKPSTVSLTQLTTQDLLMLVRPGSPAEHSGWKEGAEIIAIDGHKIDAKFSGSALSHWSEQPAGTVVTLTLADGTTRQLILADYY